MHILFFDTETNGLPKSKYALTSDVKNWPTIVQIAWELWNMPEDGTPHCQESRSYIVAPPDDVEWNAGSEAIHGIPYQLAKDEGTPGSQVYSDFSRVAGLADVLVAHNLAFDKPVLKAEFYRLSPSEQFQWWPRIEHCTMESTKELCKLPSKFPKKDPYKFPRLSELYEFLYGKATTVTLHSAAGDVSCLVACFLELARRRLVPVDAWRQVCRLSLRVPPRPQDEDK